MPCNVELKARVEDHERIRRRLDTLGPSGFETLEQNDTFFVVETGRLKLREFADGSGELIFYRRPDQVGLKVSEYRRVALDDAAAMRRLLADALPVRGAVNKTRDVVLLGTTRVHLDNVDRLGKFVEIEVVLVEGQSIADGERLATALAQELEIAADAMLSGAYIDLLDALKSAD